MDRRTFAGLCRDFIEASKPAVCEECDTPNERVSRADLESNLRFVFTGAVPYWAAEMALDTAAFLIPAPALREKIAARQDQMAIAYADKVAERLLKIYSAFSLRRMIPAELKTQDACNYARAQNLKHMAKALG
ncbi:MAG: hypothetical protein HYU57_09905 [Micavibrio aeruginosavorus]|nr:hypothetical protein [Micavibrio aeruginosavorus]